VIKQLSTKTVYKNKWMKVREDKVEFHNKSKGIYGVVEKPDFVLIIPFQDNQVCLVKQYRYPVQGSYWEFPQGSDENNPDIDIHDLVRKELKEESGLVAKKTHQLGHLFEAYGYSNQGFSIFLASELKQTEPEPEVSEADMEQKWVSFDTFEEMIARGKIKDAPTVSAYGLLKMSGALESFK